jgi:hypothetical protein
MNEPSRRPEPELDALFALARGERPDTARAEYGFETRLIARLRERHPPDTASLWSIVAWRMAPFFAVVVVTLAVWQAQSAAETAETAALTGLVNPVAGELWGDD